MYFVFKTTRWMFHEGCETQSKLSGYNKLGCCSLKNRQPSILIIFNIPGYFSKEAEQANYLSTIDSQVFLLFSLSSRLWSDNKSFQNVESRSHEAAVISRPQILTSSAGTCWWSSVSSCTAQSAGSDKQTERHQNHRRSCRTDKDTVCQRSILGENETSNLEEEKKITLPVEKTAVFLSLFVESQVALMNFISSD